MRMPSAGLQRVVTSSCTRFAAASVSLIACGRALAMMNPSRSYEIASPLFRRIRPLVLAAIVADRRLDRILGQDRAVDLHGRQGQMLGDLGVADLLRLVQG